MSLSRNIDVVIFRFLAHRLGSSGPTFEAWVTVFLAEFTVVTGKAYAINAIAITSGVAGVHVVVVAELVRTCAEAVQVTDPVSTIVEAVNCADAPTVFGLVGWGVKVTSCVARGKVVTNGDTAAIR